MSTPPSSEAGASDAVLTSAQTKRLLREATARAGNPVAVVVARRGGRPSPRRSSDGGGGNNENNNPPPPTTRRWILLSPDPAAADGDEDVNQVPRQRRRVRVRVRARPLAATGDGSAAACPPLASEAIARSPAGGGGAVQVHYHEAAPPPDGNGEFMFTALARASREACLASLFDHAAITGSHAGATAGTAQPACWLLGPLTNIQLLQRFDATPAVGDDGVGGRGSGGGGGSGGGSGGGGGGAFSFPPAVAAGGDYSSSAASSFTSPVSPFVGLDGSAALPPPSAAEHALPASARSPRRASRAQSSGGGGAAASAAAPPSSSLRPRRSTTGGGGAGRGAGGSLSAALAPPQPPPPPPPPPDLTMTATEQRFVVAATLDLTAAGESGARDASGGARGKLGAVLAPVTALLCAPRAVVAEVTLRHDLGTGVSTILLNSLPDDEARRLLVVAEATAQAPSAFEEQRRRTRQQLRRLRWPWRWLRWLRWFLPWHWRSRPVLARISGGYAVTPLPLPLEGPGGPPVVQQEQALLPPPDGEPAAALPVPPPSPPPQTAMPAASAPATYNIPPSSPMAIPSSQAQQSHHHHHHHHRRMSGGTGGGVMPPSSPLQPAASAGGSVAAAAAAACGRPFSASSAGAGADFGAAPEPLGAPSAIAAEAVERLFAIGAGGSAGGSKAATVRGGATTPPPPLGARQLIVGTDKGGGSATTEDEEWLDGGGLPPLDDNSKSTGATTGKKKNKRQRQQQQRAKREEEERRRKEDKRRREQEERLRKQLQKDAQRRAKELAAAEKSGSNDGDGGGGGGGGFGAGVKSALVKARRAVASRAKSVARGAAKRLGGGGGGARDGDGDPAAELALLGQQGYGYDDDLLGEEQDEEDPVCLVAGVLKVDLGGWLGSPDDDGFGNTAAPRLLRALLRRAGVTAALAGAGPLSAVAHARERAQAMHARAVTVALAVGLEQHALSGCGAPRSQWAELQRPEGEPPLEPGGACGGGGGPSSSPAPPPPSGPILTQALGVPAPAFSVRGPGYLSGDRRKVASGAPEMRLVAVDVVTTPGHCQHVSRFLPSVRRRPPSDGLGLVVDLMVPAGGGRVLHLVTSFFGLDPRVALAGGEGEGGGGGGGTALSSLPPHRGHSPGFARAARRFWQADAAGRRASLKLVPRVAEGSYLVKRAVGTVPVLLGQKLRTTFHDTPRYVEADVDVASSSAAAAITSLVSGATRSLVIDLAYLVEAKKAEELPEALIGAARFARIDLAAALAIDGEDEVGLTLLDGSCAREAMGGPSRLLPVPSLRRSLSVPPVSPGPGQGPVQQQHYQQQQQQQQHRHPPLAPFAAAPTLAPF